MTTNANAFEVLDSIEFQLQSPQAEPNTDPQQVSLFTHVGNSKTDLATAITGKGVTTSADATFAQMVANINAIPSGDEYALMTLTSSSANTNFVYSQVASGTQVALTYLTVPVPTGKEVSKMRATYTAGNIYDITHYDADALNSTVRPRVNFITTYRSDVYNNVLAYMVASPIPTTSLLIPVTRANATFTCEIYYRNIGG